MGKSKISMNHTMSWTGVFDILLKRGTLDQWPFQMSVLIPVFHILFMQMSGKEVVLSSLLKVIDFTLNFFPNLLGFSLGGYAIIVGFGNTELIKKISKIDDHSTYQTLNAIFSLSLIVQVIATLFSFILNFIYESRIIYSFFLSDNTVLVLSYLSFYFLVFSVLYSLILTPYLIVNLFNLSQLVNFNLTIEKIKDDKKSEKE